MMTHMTRRGFMHAAWGLGAGLPLGRAWAIEPIRRAGKARLKPSLAAYSFNRHLNLRGKAKPTMTLEDFIDLGARLELPAVELTAPVIDRDRSEVVERQRGLFDRIGDAFSGDPVSDEALYRLGAEEISRLAVQTELRERAESNTRDLLQAMLSRLGYERVVVEFAAPEL